MTNGAKARRVLVVEDEMMVAMGLELALFEVGYDVVGPFGRLDQAMDAARTGQVDMALLDVNIRGDAVFPVAEMLATRGIPYAFLTGYSGEGLPEGFASAVILSKPTRLDALVAVLRHLERDIPV